MPGWVRPPARDVKPNWQSSSGLRGNLGSLLLKLFTTHSWHPASFSRLPNFCYSSTCHRQCICRECLICNYILKINIAAAQIGARGDVWGSFCALQNAEGGCWKLKSLHQDCRAACALYMRQQSLETHWVTAWKVPEKALNAHDLIGHKQMGLILAWRASSLVLTSLQAMLLIWG